MTATLEVAAEPVPRKSRPKAKTAPAKGEPAKTPATENAARVPRIAETALARLAASVPIAAFATLLRGADARTATAARTKFAAWCAARPDLPADWRAAWALHTLADAPPAAPAVDAAPPAVPAAPAAPPAPPTTRAGAWLATL